MEKYSNLSMYKDGGVLYKTKVGFDTFIPETSVQDIRTIDTRELAIIENREKISALEEEIEKLKKATSPNVIILQEVTYEEAKSMVEDYLKTNKTAYISEIVEDLRLDLELVHQIIEELKTENKIT